MNIRINFILFIVVFFCFGVSNAFADNSANNNEKNSKISNNLKEYIVTFNNKDDKNNVIIEKQNGKIIEDFEHLPILFVLLPENAVNNIKKNPIIKDIEENVILNKKLNSEGLNAGSTTLSVYSWGKDAINTQQSLNKGINGKDVTVAVIGTGIKFHNELSTKILLRVHCGTENDYYNSFGITPNVDDCSNETGNFTDNHATEVSGVIASDTYGVSPGVNLISIRYTRDSDEMSQIDDDIRSFQYVLEYNNLNPNNPIEVVNYSSAMTQEPTALTDTINQVYNSGVLIVASAGNRNENEEVEYPAKLDNVISVGALTIHNGRYVRDTSYSPNGVEISAPGTSIRTTTGISDYKYQNGTSFAAPYVSGALALLIQQFPNDSHIDIRKKMRKNAIFMNGGTKRIDYGDMVFGDDEYGVGILQAVPVETNKVHMFHSIINQYTRPDIDSYANANAKTASYYYTQKWNDWYKVDVNSDENGLSSNPNLKWIKPNKDYVIEGDSFKVELTREETTYNSLDITYSDKYGKIIANSQSSSTYYQNNGYTAYTLLGNGWFQIWDPYESKVLWVQPANATVGEISSADPYDEYTKDDYYIGQYRAVKPNKDALPSTDYPSSDANITYVYNYPDHDSKSGYGISSDGGYKTYRLAFGELNGEYVMYREIWVGNDIYGNPINKKMWVIE